VPTGGDDDVLSALVLVGHGRGLPAGGELILPEQLAGLAVQDDDMSRLRAHGHIFRRAVLLRGDRHDAPVGAEEWFAASSSAGRLPAVVMRSTFPRIDKPCARQYKNACDVREPRMIQVNPHVNPALLMP
jgi:hypothetical protein